MTNDPRTRPEDSGIADLQPTKEERAADELVKLISARITEELEGGPLTDAETVQPVNEVMPRIGDRIHEAVAKQAAKTGQDA